MTILDYTESFAFKSFKYVIPYYIKHTSAEDNLSVFFAAVALGSLISAFIVPICHYFKSNLFLYTANILQFIFAASGFFILYLHSFKEHEVNMVQMFVALVFTGMSFSDPIHQVYMKLYACGDSETEEEMMIHFGIHHFMGILVTTIVTPVLYTNEGFRTYTIVGMVVCVVHLLTLVIVINGLKNKLHLYHPRASFTMIHSHRMLGEQPRSLKALYHWLSPSLVVLVISVFVSSYLYMSYTITAYKIFLKKFHFEPLIIGAMDAAAVAVAVVGTKLNHALLEKYYFWGYPFDLMLMYFIFILGLTGWIVYYNEYAIYTYHVVAMAGSILITTSELIARLYLVPTKEFKEVTGIGNVLSALSMFIAAIASYPLLHWNKRGSFLISLCIAMFMICLIYIVYRIRLRFLNDVFLDIHPELALPGANESSRKQNYLFEEHLYYHDMKILAHRRTPVFDQSIPMRVAKYDPKPLLRRRRDIAHMAMGKHHLAMLSPARFIGEPIGDMHNHPYNRKISNVPKQMKERAAQTSFDYHISHNSPSLHMLNKYANKKSSMKPLVNLGTHSYGNSVMSTVIFDSNKSSMKPLVNPGTHSYGNSVMSTVIFDSNKSSTNDFAGRAFPFDNNENKRNLSRNINRGKSKVSSKRYVSICRKYEGSCDEDYGIDDSCSTEDSSSGSMLKLIRGIKHEYDAEYQIHEHRKRSRSQH